MFLSSGGPAPVIRSVAFFEDGTVTRDSSGHPTACTDRLREEDLEGLEKLLRDAKDLLAFAWSTWGDDVGGDAAELTFVFAEPPAPGVGREISVPIELFPVGLLPLARTIDDLVAGACPGFDFGIVERVQRR